MKQDTSIAQMRPRTDYYRLHRSNVRVAASGDWHKFGTARQASHVCKLRQEGPNCLNCQRFKQDIEKQALAPSVTQASFLLWQRRENPTVLMALTLNP